MANQTFAKAERSSSRGGSAQRLPRARLSATHPLLHLQRAVGNLRAQRLLNSGSIRPVWLRTGGPARIQRQAGTDYGLGDVTSRKDFVTKAADVLKNQPSITVEDFANTLMKHIEADLLKDGVPEVKWKLTPGLGASGRFDQKAWLVEIDPEALGLDVKGNDIDKDTAVSLLPPATARDFAGTLYHESRHIDQDVLIVRVLLDQQTDPKKAVAEVARFTDIPTRIVQAIRNTTFKTPVGAAQLAHAERMIVVLYGQHKEFVTFLVKQTPLVGAIQSLKFVKAGELAAAEPDVNALEQWATTVLEPKVKTLAALKKPQPLEAQLKRDLGALSQATTQLVAAFRAARKKPNAATVGQVKTSAKEWERKLLVPYNNLESEKEAAQVEKLVKDELKKQAAKPKTPPPKKP